MHSCLHANHLSQMLCVIQLNLTEYLSKWFVNKIVLLSSFGLTITKIQRRQHFFADFFPSSKFIHLSSHSFFKRLSSNAKWSKKKMGWKISAFHYELFIHEFKAKRVSFVTWYTTNSRTMQRYYVRSFHLRMKKNI